MEYCKEKLYKWLDNSNLLDRFVLDSYKANCCEYESKIRLLVYLDDPVIKSKIDKLPFEVDPSTNSKDLADDLTKYDLKFVTKVRKNMKKKMLSAFEKFFLKQRGIVARLIF